MCNIIGTGIWGRRWMLCIRCIIRFLLNIFSVGFVSSYSLNNKSRIFSFTFRCICVLFYQCSALFSLGYVASKEKKKYASINLFDFNCFAVLLTLLLPKVIRNCVGKWQTMSRFVKLLQIYLSFFFFFFFCVSFCQIGIFCLTSNKNVYT